MQRSRKDQSATVNTASLPDIVFMLLFFFMTVTVIKDNTLMVENALPEASEIKKLENKDLVIEIYIGKPNTEHQATHGTESKIQIGDKLVDLALVGSKVVEKRNKIPEALRPKITVALKIDREANMGLLDDLKQELRKVDALKVNYVTLDEGI